MTPKQNNQYFTKEHENAILEYASIIDERRRTFLYVNYIQPAFNEMVDKIVFTYKFNSLPNIDDLKSECKVWLTTILDKYDTSRGSKAFSYFSVITKNWFIHKVKKNSTKKEVYLEDIKNTSDEKDLIIYNDYDEKRELGEFWTALRNEIDVWETKKMKPNEQKVYKAVKLLIEDNNTIEIFNKKAIYLYIREITGLNTKQVVCNLKKFKIKYVEFKKKWDNGEVTHISGGIIYER